MGQWMITLINVHFRKQLILWLIGKIKNKLETSLNIRCYNNAFNMVNMGESNHNYFQKCFLHEGFTSSIVTKQIDEGYIPLAQLVGVLSQSVSEFEIKEFCK